MAAAPHVEHIHYVNVSLYQLISLVGVLGASDGRVSPVRVLIYHPGHQWQMQLSLAPVSRLHPPLLLHLA
jgi:hypothetical protein